MSPSRRNFCAVGFSGNQNSRGEDSACASPQHWPSNVPKFSSCSDFFLPNLENVPRAWKINMVVLKPKWFPNLLQASCPDGHSMRCYSSCTSKSQMSLGDFAQLKLEKHQVFNGYDKAYQETSNAHSTWHPLKKRDKHHHHWWRWTAEIETILAKSWHSCCKMP